MSVVKTSGSLFVIAAVAAAALGFVNSATEATIQQREIETKNQAMKDVLPDAAKFSADNEINEGVITSYSEGSANGKVVGYAFSVETSGFDKGLKLMVGIDKDGVISGVKVIGSKETAGLGARAEEVLSPEFKGKSGELTVNKTGNAGDSEINAITGATITSNAVTGAVNDVQDYFDQNLKGGKG